MEYHFHPSLQVEEERYGNAILTRFPLRLVKAGALPTLPGRRLEPRGAIWVAVSIDDREIHLLNTHLGLLKRERMLQVEALLSDQWLGNLECSEPRILCGDLNAFPRSKVHKRLCCHLRDLQLSLNNHRPQRTWSSQFPVGRIDHVFSSTGVKVVAIDAARSQLARVASDHLPLVVEIQFED
jgi:endonuclease/exonuclease/phosphatase family metal-dependent hydrolase